MTKRSLHELIAIEAIDNMRNRQPPLAAVIAHINKGLEQGDYDQARRNELVRLATEAAGHSEVSK